VASLHPSVRLARWCARTGNSQVSLAKLLGVAQPTVSRILHGRLFPSEGLAERIEAATGVSACGCLHASSGARCTLATGHTGSHRAAVGSWPAMVATVEPAASVLPTEEFLDARTLRTARALLLHLAEEHNEAFRKATAPAVKAKELHRARACTQAAGAIAYELGEEGE
jgi:transcriptional regulator with XRE-family HTH domain